ncbi:WD-40 repeat protein [Cardiosporidium cionae]|uniref:Mitochondrial pyruvate carrier n=1 Tax=Cardiosporidium cionae TaxID=476202 RepID=A0ABQ7JCX4_9APIC|nr:WD-40 repeat protein [Cardiosporidium cionae]|eukprot:KAF8821775.1 WD-40 repeat protein [Cardiosporidium cionae]
MYQKMRSSSGTSVVGRIMHQIAFPGVVPALRTKLQHLPLPSGIRFMIEHPAGPLTIHFWAPTCKWFISLANILDIDRPVEKISAAQQTAVAFTGIIWSRTIFAVHAVNVAMAITGLYQLQRLWRYHYGTRPVTTLK